MSAPNVIPAVIIGGVTYVAITSGDAPRAPSVPIRGVLPPPQQLQPKVDLLGMALQGAYNLASDEAKSATAAYFNDKLDLDPPLQGDETWERVSAAIGGASGGALAALVPGVGPALAPMAAMCGQYLGVQFEQWVASEMPDIQRWVEDNVSSVASDVASYIRRAIGSIF